MTPLGFLRSLCSRPLADEGLQRASAEQGDEAGERQQRAALRGDAVRVAAAPAEQSAIGDAECCCSGHLTNLRANFDTGTWREEHQS